MRNWKWMQWEDAVSCTIVEAPSFQLNMTLNHWTFGIAFWVQQFEDDLVCGGIELLCFTLALTGEVEI